MQKSTKKYIQSLIDWMEVQLNTAQFELEEMHRTRRKLKKIFKKLNVECDKLCNSETSLDDGCMF